MGDMEMNELSPNDASRFSQLEQIISPDMVEWALQKTYEFARLMSYYKCAMMEIETKLNVLISSRPKRAINLLNPLLRIHTDLFVVFSFLNLSSAENGV